MHRWRTFVVASGVVLLMGGGAAAAQTSDQEWLANCREQRSWDRARHCEVRPVQVQSTGRLRVDASPNGGISVAGGEQGHITATARIQAEAPSEEVARDMVSRITIDTSNGLSVRGPESERKHSWSVSFVIRTPGQIDLDLTTTNGPLTIQDVTGRIEAETTNGPVALRRLGGDVKVRATNGPISVALHGAAWNGVGLDARASNGPATLTVPHGYSAQLDVGTSNGPFHLGIPITVQGELPTRSLQTTLGSGGATIRVRTTNGPMSLVEGK